ncbi:related to Tyrosine-protein phosphatase 3 [Zygosaccharomyces bailii]|nr:related to Tyrosine-protein phosphatase 3 [Zygosaccharomyces bailii]
MKLDHHSTCSDASTDTSTRDSMSTVSDSSSISSCLKPPMQLLPTLMTPSSDVKGATAAEQTAAEVSPISYPVLLKSVSAPVLPSFKPQDQRLPKPTGCALVSAMEFGKTLHETDQGDLLVFDVRPYIEFSKATVPGAVHVCLPSTLLRRKSFTFQKLVDNLSPAEQSSLKSLLLNPRLRVIIYDNNANQSEDSVSLACSGIATKVMEYFADRKEPHHVAILASGFGQLQALYPELIVLGPEEESKVDFQLQVPQQMNGPISSSSPISALLKFKLPQEQVSCFKLAQNEEIMNLESYLSAVNLKEEQEEVSMNTFQFPRRKTTGDFQIGGSETGRNVKGSGDKLRFQIKYASLIPRYGQWAIDSMLPLWFQRLMARSKIDFILQFQKLDFLEKKRLNKSFSHRASHSALYAPRNQQQPAQRKLQKRSHSHPEYALGSPKTSKALFTLESEDEDDETVTISSGVELGTKNRYKDIFPYEHSRVVLRKSLPTLAQTPAASDNIDIWDSYINANYLNMPHLLPPDGLSNTTTSQDSSCKVRYIASQAPLASTVYDFYTCILNNRVPLVLTLTDSFENGMEKCFPYWEEGDYGGIKVNVIEATNVPSLMSSKSESSTVIRRLQLTYEKNKTFQVLQVHITNWPDLGTLLDSTQIIQAISVKNTVMQGLFNNNVYAKDQVPTILVHCSAGCGRTGTWCTLDSIISNLETFNLLDQYYQGEKTYDPVVWTINIFRKQRISMVQNVNQFLFIYDCLLNYFLLRLNVTIEHEQDTMQKLLEQISNMEIVKNLINSKIFEMTPP